LRIDASATAHREGGANLLMGDVVITSAATRLSSVLTTRPAIEIFCPGNNPYAEDFEDMTRTGPYEVAAMNEYLRAAKLRPKTLGVVATGSERTRASKVNVLPKCWRSSLVASEYWRRDMMDEPSKSAEIRTIARVRLNLSSTRNVRAPTASRVPGYNKLCASAPTHVAPPKASARLSTKRGACF
jgi:hypothetical protein